MRVKLLHFNKPLQQSDTREFDLNSYKPLFAMNLLSWLVVAILVVVGAERPVRFKLQYYFDLVGRQI
jgi:hypothetical protein